MPPARPGPELISARRAVAALFLLNAVAFANVVPRLPGIKEKLGLSNTAFGTAIAAMPVGALTSGPAAGYLVARFTSARVVVACAVAIGLVLTGFALAPSWVALAGMFLVLGALDSLMDISMNAHALRVQRGFGRSIINSFHGLWSVGAVIGGLTGSLAVATGLRPTLHLMLAGGVIAVVAFAARRWLLPGHDEPEVAPVEPGDGDAVTVGRDSRRPAVLALAVLGLIVVMSAIIEDAPASWGAVLLRTELGASAGIGGLVYLAFHVSMTIGRLLGDRIVDRFGEVATVRLGGAVTALAVGAGLAVGTPASVIVGFAIAGAGTAALFPLVFHAAANIDGVPTSYGVAAVATLARLGFLVAPPLIGLIGDAFSVRAGLVLVPVAGAMVALLAPALAPRSRAGVSR